MRYTVAELKPSDDLCNWCDEPAQYVMTTTDIDGRLKCWYDFACQTHLDELFDPSELVR